MIIPPTVGRVVHYFPREFDAEYAQGKPLAAIITGIMNETMVHLTVMPVSRSPFSTTKIRLVNPGDLRPELPYCEWPEYRKA